MLLIWCKDASWCSKDQTILILIFSVRIFANRSCSSHYPWPYWFLNTHLISWVLTLKLTLNTHLMVETLILVHSEIYLIKWLIKIKEMLRGAHFAGNDVMKQACEWVLKHVPEEAFQEFQFMECSNGEVCEGWGGEYIEGCKY